MDIKKNLVIYAVLFTVFFVNTNAYAVRWTGEGGLHTGGDTLENTIDSNGNPFSIKAGDLLTLAIGPHFDLTDNTHIRTLIGWKSDSTETFDGASTTSTGGNVSFERFPIDVMYFYQTRNWNFGAGITYHLNPKLSGSGVIDRGYNDSLGYAFEVDFRLGDFFYLGGKYTFIDYDEKNSNTIVDGNSIGVVIGFVFGDKK
jgi:hypothetical protein